MLPPVFGVLFDGLAYGMLLFLLSVGQSVTLGMMNFINLAHCSFAMLGGYVTVALMSRYGWPFFATLPCAFVVAAVVSVAFERTFFRRLYRASELDQVLLDHRHRFYFGGGSGLHFQHRSATVAAAALSAHLAHLHGHSLRGVPA